MLSDHDKSRYSRQILFEPLGEAGQQRLQDSRAAIVGCGALGSFQAAALARSGVGEIRIIDRDYVELSNLQRQWLFDESDAAQGLPKAVAAARKLATVNSNVRVDAAVADLHAGNVETLLADVDVILDGTDNFEARYLINELAVKLGKPWIYGAAVGDYGIAAPILPGRSACLACLLPEPPGGALPTCDTAGILNVAASAVASFQVADALKLLACGVESVEPRLLTLELWKGSARSIPAPDPGPDCRVCGQRLFELLDARDTPRAAVLCGRNAVQVPGDGATIDLLELRNRLAGLGEVRSNDYALCFAAESYELTIFEDGRAIVKGTSDIGLARSLYARFVGR